MSLHTASKYLASKGRKGDTELVHMTKDEIKGLQQLALAHGGSLTINPETGLVEAGILKTILPMVAGAAITVATGGTAAAAFAPYLAALAAGGGMYAATGSVKEGLMAGLGAFGGANLAGGLMEAGMAGAAETGGNVVAETAAQTPGQIVEKGLTTSTGQVIPAGTLEGAANSIAQAPAGADVTQLIPKGYELGSGQLGNQVAALQGNAPLDYAGAVGQTVDAGAKATPTFMQNLEQAGRGLPKIGEVIMNAPGKTALPLAVAGFAGSQDSGVQGFPPNQDTSSGATLSSSFQGFTPTQPDPYYQAQYQDYRKKQQGGGVGGVGALAEGGIAGLAGGGMDPMNPVQNPIYPQSQQEHTNFASSTQYPNSIKSAMAADYDTRTNPMTGQELPMGLAAGGVIAMASGTPKTLSRSPGMPDGGVYRDTDPDTATKDAFTAAQIRLGKINKAAGLKGLTLPKANMTQLGGSFDSVEDKAQGGIAHYNLGGYSDGGRMLKGPGDGMSDSIPASIGGKQAARLADGEFVVPADVVSHLGNGSTDAGAKKLYGMMDKVRHARTGTKKQGKQIKADKYLPK